MDWLTACKEFGVIGGLLIGLLIAMLTVFILGAKWILQQFKVELDGNRTERKEYLQALLSIQNEVCEHNTRSKEFMERMINDHSEMTLQLREITLALGRINGYKH